MNDKMTIVPIPLDMLEPHPDNPRKELGDLTELADSIKTNGIMQNLTVVASPDSNKYRVVIGHRRMAAAKLAGLTELPCVVSDMDHKEQVATMLAENMQRSDLTAIEQAEGSVLLRLAVLDFAAVSGACGAPDFKGRIFFSAGKTPELRVKLKKGEDSLKLAEQFVALYASFRNK